MIALVDNKSIRRLKFLNNASFLVLISWLICYPQEQSWDQNSKKLLWVSTSWSKCRPHDQICKIFLPNVDFMIKSNFNLMSVISISWKKQISIFWNSTSWSFPVRKLMFLRQDLFHYNMKQLMKHYMFYFDLCWIEEKFKKAHLLDK
jgi:hypothetical protein